MKSKLFYEVRGPIMDRDISEYRHVKINIYDAEEAWSWSNSDVEFEWQSDKHEGKWREWYGFHVQVRTGTPGRFVQLSRLVNRIMPKDESFKNPRTFLEHLDKYATRCVYDARLGERVAISNLAPEGWRCFYNDLSCDHYKLMAPDELTAKTLFLKDMADDEWATKQFVERDCLVHAHDNGIAAQRPIVERLENILGEDKHES